MDGDPWYNARNAEAIAAAPADITRLLAEVRRLHEENDRLREENTRLNM